MTFDEWTEKVPVEIKGDALWKVTAYRLSLFLADIGWKDVSRLAQDRRTVSPADQLYRSLGSVCANVEVGFSRFSHKDRARYYDYALGSARESRGWYSRGRHVLGETVATHRIQLLTRVIQLLLVMAPEQRGYSVREPNSDYEVESSPTPPSDAVLRDIPMPDPVLIDA